MGISRYFRAKEELMVQQEPDVYFPNSLKLVKNDGVCPGCSGDNVEWGSPETEGNTIFRCCDYITSCYEWVERYILAFKLNGIKHPLLEAKLLSYPPLENLSLENLG